MMSGIGEQGSPLGCGVLEVSSRVKVDSCDLFVILALSLRPACIFPVSFRGATALLSFLRDFMNDQNLFAFQDSDLSLGHRFQIGFQCASGQYAYLSAF